MAITYKEAGVDIRAGEETVERIKPLVRSTFSPRVLTDIGMFGAFYDAHFPEYKHPVLVSSVDGVGTKLKVAIAANKHTTIGQDLVNHCVNDIAVCGAVPLFFLDYFAAGKLVPDIAAQVIEGFVIACRENNCSLVGGETAEMPSVYREGDYDVAGTIVGIVDKEKIVKGSAIAKGDVLIGVPSTGLHTNGYSLARRVLFQNFGLDSFREELGTTVGDALLKVHRSYLATIQEVIKTLGANEGVRGFSHVTGGGIAGNTSRILPAGRKLHINWDSWTRPGIYSLIQRLGMKRKKKKEI